MLTLECAIGNLFWKLNHKTDKGEWLKIDQLDVTIRELKLTFDNHMREQGICPECGHVAGRDDKRHCDKCDPIINGLMNKDA